MSKMKEYQGKMIEFDLSKLKQLKKAYTEAVKDEKEVFTFEGDEWVVGYAKYAIIYLEDRFGIKKIA